MLCTRLPLKRVAPGAFLDFGCQLAEKIFDLARTAHDREGVAHEGLDGVLAVLVNEAGRRRSSLQPTDGFDQVDVARCRQGGQRLAPRGENLSRRGAAGGTRRGYASPPPRSPGRASNSP